MARSWLGLALCALMLLPAGVLAQDNNVVVYSVAGAGRPRIGVTVDGNASAANNKLGATIASVLPDGPAAKAGLQAGDIITKFNGTSLAGVASDEPGQAGPGQKLVELAQKLSPGDSVKVEYRRGTASRTATVVAADLGGEAMAFGSGPGRRQTIELDRAMGSREMAMHDLERSVPDMGNQFMFRFDGGSFGLELAEMNAGLGEYFGTARGVLVLEDPADSTVPLRAGDVILAIDGRQPASVGQARRIFGSYDSGDVAKFEIMRMRKKITVSWTVPENRRMQDPGMMRWRTPGPPGLPAEPGSAPRTRVRVAPSVPATPTTAPVAPALPVERT